MRNRDKIEFYDGDKLLIFVTSSIVPTMGSCISIKRKKWLITTVSFAVEYVNFDAVMRCRVNLMLLEQPNLANCAGDSK